MQTIYMDNAATTFPKPDEVIRAVNDCLTNYAVSPRRGNNRLVHRATEELEGVRERVSSHFAVDPQQLAFVPSATYGINLVMQGLSLRQGDTVYLSPFEHNSVVRCAESLKQSRGVNWRLLPMNREGHIDLEELRKRFEQSYPVLVVMTHASNVTGDVLPIRLITEVAHHYGAKVMIDAAQTAGCYTPSMTEYDYDYLAFSSHKGLYGIAGSGGVVIKNPQHELTPLLFGGTGINSEDVEMPHALPERLEAGTAPLPAIVSMSAGLKWIEEVGPGVIADKITRLRSAAVLGLSEVPGLTVHGSESAANIGIVAITSDLYTPQELNTLLDSKNICVRSGLHCSPLAHRTLGTTPFGVTRISFSWFNEAHEVDALLEQLWAIS